MSEPTGVEQLLLSAVRLVQEAIGTSGACCRCSFPCYQLILCTRLCVHDSRHAAHGSRQSHVFISSHMVPELLFVHGNIVTCFGEPSETDGGSVTEIFSGDGDLNGRVNSMPWSQWGPSVRSYFGELNQTAVQLLQLVETNVQDPVITDHTTMTGAERRLSEQLYCVLALTCRKRALQEVQQGPRGYEFELCRKFRPHPPVRSRGMLQALLSLTKSAEPKRLVRQ